MALPLSIDAASRKSTEGRSRRNARELYLQEKSWPEIALVKALRQSSQVAGNRRKKIEWRGKECMGYLLYIGSFQGAPLYDKR